MTVASLLRWEWFKLRGRRVMWVLLIVLLAFSSVIVFIRFGDWQFVKDRDVIDEVRFLPGVLEDRRVEVDLNCTEFLSTGVLPADVELPQPLTVDDIDLGATSEECRQETLAIEAGSTASPPPSRCRRRSGPRSAGPRCWSSPSSPSSW